MLRPHLRQPQRYPSCPVRVLRLHAQRCHQLRLHQLALPTVGQHEGAGVLRVQRTDFDRHCWPVELALSPR